MTTPAQGSPLPPVLGGSMKPAWVTTLRTRFNRRTGKIEATKNGLMTHRGFLKFQPNQRLNRRQVLRGYR